MFQAQQRWGSPPRSQEAAGGRAGWGVGTVRLRYGKRIFPLWASSFPFRIRDCGGCGMLVSKTWTFESLDKWDIDFFSFLLLDAPSPSICLHWLGLQRRYQELTLNGPHPAEPRGGSRAGKGCRMTGAFFLWRTKGRPGCSMCIKSLPDPNGLPTANNR